METTLAILMVLGIFVGIPALVGFAIAGGYIMSDSRLRRTERAKALEREVQVLQKQPVEAQGKALAKKTTTKRVPVA